ncbi:MAG: N,N-dimethylformamidase beta subunit family domain-containing protein, partial [Chloroflexota bacterium]
AFILFLSSGLPSGAVESEAIEGYASVESINIGESIDFHVSTIDTSYFIDIYRIGWYGGMGGRWVDGYGPFTGTFYGVPSADPSTGYLDADWPVAMTLTTTADWESGYYVARLTTDTNQIGYIIFILRNDSEAADIMYVPPISTYQAYNNWGGQSVYGFNSVGRQAAYNVSFNRPYAAADGAGRLFGGDYQMIRWLERNGYDATYASSYDLHTDSTLIDGHSVFLANLHDEYYTRPMRENVVAARDAGTDLAYFTANNIYWQMRYEDNGRRLVTYKEVALTTDPFAIDADTSNDDLITVRWRDAPLNEPEQGILGAMYEADFGDSVHQDWIVSGIGTTLGDLVYAGTGLSNGDVIPEVIGDEYDRVWDGIPTPAGLVELSDSPIDLRPLDGSQDGVQNATIYQDTTSGAYVFDAATNSWAQKLDETNYDTDISYDANIDRMTRNILNAMIGTTNVPPIAEDAYVFDDGPTFEWTNNNSPLDFREETVVNAGRRALRVDLSSAGGQTSRLSLRNFSIFDATPYTYLQLDVRGTLPGQDLYIQFWNPSS